MQVRTPKQKYGPAAKDHWLLTPGLIPALVALATFGVFSRALSGGFVSLDDPVNILNNPSYRGLGWPQIRWMFTTALRGPYQPLSWLTYGLDYSLWGMNPFGYHLTNVLLHSANAVLFYFLCFRLIRTSAREESSVGDCKVALASACAALLFSIHPLRVESVAWITERRDVLSGFFYLSSILTPVRGKTTGNPSPVVE